MTSTEDRTHHWSHPRSFEFPWMRDGSVTVIYGTNELRRREEKRRQI